MGFDAKKHAGTGKTLLEGVFGARSLWSEGHTTNHTSHRSIFAWCSLEQMMHLTHPCSKPILSITALFFSRLKLSFATLDTPTVRTPTSTKPQSHSQMQNPGHALEPLAFAKALASITHVLDSFAAIPITVPAMGYSHSTESKPKKASLSSSSAMEEGEAQPAGSNPLNSTGVTVEEEGSSSTR